MIAPRIERWLSRWKRHRSVTADDIVSFCVGTDQGLSRNENQDRVLVAKIDRQKSDNSPLFVAVISDGMGGMIEGRRCSIITLSAFLGSFCLNDSFAMEERIEIAISEANAEVFSRFSGRGGATFSLLVIDSSGIPYISNIGDSRIYGHRDGKIERLTIDDSLEERVGGHGKGLLQFMGMGYGIKIEVIKVEREFEQFILTTDGVHFINEKTLSDIVINSELKPFRTVQRLLALAGWSGSPDNATACVVNVEKVIESTHKQKISANDQSSTFEPLIEITDPFGELSLLLNYVVEKNKNSLLDGKLQKVKEDGEQSSTIDYKDKLDESDVITEIEKKDEILQSPVKKLKKQSKKSSFPKNEQIELVIKVDDEEVDG